MPEQIPFDTVRTNVQVRLFPAHQQLFYLLIPVQTFSALPLAAGAAFSPLLFAAGAVFSTFSLLGTFSFAMDYSLKTSLYTCLQVLIVFFLPLVASFTCVCPTRVGLLHFGQITITLEARMLPSF